MKVLLVLIAFLAINTATAQINLVHSFEAGELVEESDFRLIYLSEDEPVFASLKLNSGQNVIQLFDLDFNLIQTIDIAEVGSWFVAYITRELFDCDPTTIEYVVSSSIINVVRVYRDDGTLLFEQENARIGIAATTYLIENRLPVVNTPAGTFFNVFRSNSTMGDDGLDIYELCGTLPVPCCNSGNDDPTNLPPVGSSMVNYSLALPNPTSDIFTVKLGQPMTRSGVIKIFDTSGQMVLTNVLYVGEEKATVNLSAHPAGTYIYRIETENESIFQGKIVKQ